MTNRKFSVVPNPDFSSNQQKYYLGSKSQHDMIVNDEEILICAAIISPEKIPVIESIVKPEHFFTPSNKELYASCLELYKIDNGKVEYQTLIIYLTNHNLLDFVGGRDKIEEILSKVTQTLNIEVNAKNLLDKAIRFNLQKEGIDINKKAQENFGYSTKELIQEVEAKIQKLKDELKSIDGQEEKSSSWSYLSMDFAIQLLDDWGSGKSLGYTTGIHDLDDAVGGFTPGDFIMLAGPSGIGKTALGCSLMHKFVLQDIPCLFLSGEMPAKQIAGRVLSCHTGINSRLLARDYKKLTEQQVSGLLTLAEQTQHFPMAIKSVGTGIREIENAIQSAKLDAIESQMKHFDGGFKVIFLDYLQLLAGGEDKSDNRSLEIDRLAQWCKRYAIENDCVIIAFAQINDDVLNRSGNRVPNMNDIGWCRTAKNHVDYLAFLWTDYYNSMGTQNQVNVMPDKEILEIWFRKSRHTGFLGKVETLVTRSICRVDPIVRQP